MLRLKPTRKETSVVSARGKEFYKEYFLDLSFFFFFFEPPELSKSIEPLEFSKPPEPPKPPKDPKFLSLSLGDLLSFWALEC